VYPGWYSGRTVHIHFKIRTTAPNGRDYEHTSQLFFDDRLTDIVHGKKPYLKKGQRDTRNKDDNFFQQGGDQLLLKVTGNSESGYYASISIGLDLTDAETGTPDIL
jgi:hypothetical protein